jgi:hypothetical protein
MDKSHAIEDKEKRERVETYIRMMQTAIEGIHDEIEAERYFGSTLSNINLNVLELAFKYVPPKDK